MNDNSPSPVSQLLVNWRNGDTQALAKLLPLVYDEMRHLAARYMQNERPNHTLQATALVHEAYARMINMEISVQDRSHFFAIAAQTMRRILVDHARAKGRQRRGGGWKKQTLDEGLIIAPQNPVDMLALDEALSDLESHDARAGRAIELHYFGGLSYDEISVVLSVSTATVDRDLRLAKAWLNRHLAE